MVGFRAAVTHAPLTAFIIAMEMIDGHAMALSLMTCALIRAESRGCRARRFIGLSHARATRSPVVTAVIAASVQDSPSNREGAPRGDSK
jgi:hypothetical protein